ncbi:TetR/AcrR family transcriptional regulator [Candidatus Magnetaquicoccus inordinatus]|uniref:TetR/AcrR family transcriptional regulator n=1 Tax=Candidatus Magnetaquicoccus inordinatus TaxID=2496818 RepID=UPI0012922AFF|nr:TetR/AcrR family transcriptional regulator [Candidatus Magnetaquicoccus inordinatus]
MGRTSDAKERLIQSGMALIHAGGYAQAGVQEICLHAGVRKGSFYHFFASKSALALAVVERFRLFSEQFLDQALANDLPPLDRLTRLFHMTALLQQQSQTENGFVKGCPFGNLALEMSGHDESLRHALMEVFANLQLRLQQVLHEAAVTQAENKAEALVNLFEGSILLAKTHNDPQIIHRMGAIARKLAR